MHPVNSCDVAIISRRKSLKSVNVEYGTTQEIRRRKQECAVFGTARHMNKDEKIVRQPLMKPERALEQEKARIRHALPDILAREASEIASKQHNNRLAALDDVQRRIMHGEHTLFALAFFECLHEWLAQHEHHDTARTVRAFIDERLASRSS
jgi:hypothetical protein